jgi:hypothetical protein
MSNFAPPRTVPLPAPSHGAPDAPARASLTDRGLSAICPEPQAAPAGLGAHPRSVVAIAALATLALGAAGCWSPDPVATLAAQAGVLAAGFVAFAWAVRDPGLLEPAREIGSEANASSA